jgi:UDP-N-acetyl-D-galactosamine dehydrogenase
VGSEKRLAVIGLGYVGLPLAVALAKHFDVLGYDSNPVRIDELRKGHDRIASVTPAALAATKLKVSAEEKDLDGADIFFVAVPTVLDAKRNPDLSAVKRVTALVAHHIKRGGVFVLESSVAPGTTETVCAPILAAESGLVPGKDVFLAYSPERVNPGDDEHTVERITKVVAAQNHEIAAALARIYGKVTGGKVFVAKNIKTAEATKLFENIQRDINIAYVNEAAMLFNRMGISVYDVIDAAKTKWNALSFRPGLVGGHCISVNPYYLAEAARAAGYEPNFFMKAREINDGFARYVAGEVARRLAPGSRILVLGLAFKEDVGDTKESLVNDIVRSLVAAGHRVEVHDPLAKAEEVSRRFGHSPLPSLDGAGPYHAVLGAVAHRAYREMTREALLALLLPGALVADIKGMWRALELPPDFRRWTL